MSEEAVKIKKRRRRKSYPVKLTYNGKIYRGYGYEKEGEWLILDTGAFDNGSGKASHIWFALDKVNTFAIEEQRPVQYPAYPPSQFYDGGNRPVGNLKDLVNVDPRLSAERTEQFRAQRNRELEQMMGPDNA